MPPIPRPAASAALAAVALLAAAAPATATGSGGTPVRGTVPTGGTAYRDGEALKPVAQSFAVAPSRVTAPGLPAVRFRVEQASARAVRARIVFWPVSGGRLARLDLGPVATGTTIAVHWPAGFGVVPGSYLVRLHVRGRGNRVLARNAGVSTRANLVVAPRPAPPPPPAPAPAAPVPPVATAPATAGAITPGVFPIQGPHTYGGGVGAPRTGHLHQGQDLPAAAGTPVVAPVAGSVLTTSYQAAGAGFYVVEQADDGRAFFFAHCLAGSTAVARGQRLAPGTRLCSVGSTGDSTGPHLHFEIWVGGWRASAASRFVDPLPQLRAWDH